MAKPAILDINRNTAAVARDTVSGKVLVLGLGNTLLSDEGVGVHVIRYLQARSPAVPGIEYMDGGTLSFDLTVPIESADALIVVDAAELGAAPGTVRCYRDAAMDTFVGGNRKRSVHEVSLLDLLAIACLSDHLPQRRALVGIQPQRVDWGEAPSAVVAGAIPIAGRQVLDILAEWHT